MSRLCQQAQRELHGGVGGGGCFIVHSSLFWPVREREISLMSASCSRFRRFWVVGQVGGATGGVAAGAGGQPELLSSRTCRSGRCDRLRFDLRLGSKGLKCKQVYGAFRFHPITPESENPPELMVFTPRTGICSRQNTPEKSSHWHQQIFFRLC